jgi:1-acyl-sn-glycerol-3-phosphate acyltransferase
MALKATATGISRFLRILAKYVGRAVFFSGGFHWVPVYGEMNEDVKILTFAPHMSFTDSLGFVKLNYPSSVSRHSQNDAPIFGNLIKLTESLLVDRDKHSSRSTVVKKIHDRVFSPYKWQKLAIFPEGTCTNGKALIKFKPGKLFFCLTSYVFIFILFKMLFKAPSCLVCQYNRSASNTKPNTKPLDGHPKGRMYSRSCG